MEKTAIPYFTASGPVNQKILQRYQFSTGKEIKYSAGLLELWMQYSILTTGIKEQPQMKKKKLLLLFHALTDLN